MRTGVSRRRSGGSRRRRNEKGGYWLEILQSLLQFPLFQASGNYKFS